MITKFCGNSVVTHDSHAYKLRERRMIKIHEVIKRSKRDGKIH